MNHKSKTQTTSEVSRRKFLGVAALTPVALAVHRVGAQDPIPPPPQQCPHLHMGTVGVAAGQKLRVSVFNHADEPQGFKIELFGLDGSLLAGVQGGCLPNAGAFADFDVAAGMSGGERVQVHIHVTAFSDQALGATAEVFDLKSGISKGGFIAPCDTPVPDPLMALGSVGLARGQVARVSVFHEPSPNAIPCDAVVEIRRLDGTLLATQIHVLYGTGTALSATGSQIWHQDSAGIGGSVEANDKFGLSLASKTSTPKWF